MAKRKKFKYLEVIAFAPSWAIQGGGECDLGHRGLQWNERVLYLGDIPNVSGHCAIARCTGEVMWLMHPEDFRKAKDEEL